MSTFVGIVDYGMGNINSVDNALNYLGIDHHIVSHTQEIASCSHLIIPGVGAYHEAMSNLNRNNLCDAITKHTDAKKPLLGICLGMQILSDTGEEMGESMGLGFIPGKVQLLQLADKNLPIPHIGWNSLEFHRLHPILTGVKKHVDFYFVHSYFFNADNEQDVLATTEYGKKFPAIIARENIVGIQFHPEKSQDNGLLLIENFCEWDGQC